MNIRKPTLLLDIEKCKRNIRFMAEKAKKHNVSFRPHFKTHQSKEIGAWFKDVGVSKITVSSLTMAEYFAKDWNDITVAFPVNILEVDTINKLAKNIRLTLLAESTEVVDFLSKKCINEIGVYIKIDTGNHRTGIDPENYELISSILNKIKRSDKIKFEGFLAHSGHTYICRNGEGIDKIQKDSLNILQKLKHTFHSDFPNLKISVGDTPGCSISKTFNGADEIRPGNFVFYDLTQQAIGSCKSENISVAMACPIVAIQNNRNEIVIYGGGVHFSKEVLEQTGMPPSYGQIVEPSANGWGNIIPNMYVKSLSQEHGIVSVPEKLLNNYRIGDLLYILPVHSCMTANLMKEYTTLNGSKISMMTKSC